MALAVTAQRLEEHGVADTSHPGAVGILPNLFEPPMDRNAMPAEGCHLWHERQPVQAASLIERRENLWQAPDLDHFTRAQRRTGIQAPTDCERDRTGYSLPRSNWKIWYSALFTGISIDDDETADCDEGRSCSTSKQSDYQQAE
jgi:hypothetical protein